MKATIRLRMSQLDAHYGGNLVAGATQLEIIGDLITELAMRYDGDEGLFRAYESVEFLAPLFAGDWVEGKGRIVSAGSPFSWNGLSLIRTQRSSLARPFLDLSRIQRQAGAAPLGNDSVARGTAADQW